ncbi:MAG: GNAT family N-acetyltransferase [Lachnospiraceae bacterium]|nr:GNAT family N-acetyltransferase [Lachnospiraceae bacterium]
MEQIRYVKQHEKQKARAMYEAVFPEDPKEFVDYYFQWKTRDNQVLVMEEADMVQVMMHLNPYTIQIYGHLRELPYIVAVASHPSCRRQGKMGRVMEYALQDMERMQVPFTFLLPADPAYYKGQGFVFFPCQGVAGAEAEADVPSGYTWQEAQEGDLAQAAEFSNNILERDYHIFIKRDMDYYKRLMAETHAEHGRLLLLKYQGLLKGILVYGVEQGEPKAEIQELLLSPEIQGWRDMLCHAALPGLEIQFCEFQMMFRIASLREFVSLLKSEEGHSFEVMVQDAMVPKNAGAYRIEIDRDGGRIERMSGKLPEKKMDIQELAQALLEHTRVSLREWV